jgi:MFS family permease
LSAAVAVLAVAQGIGRFAYTPLLPAMQTGAGLSHEAAGLIASANMAGYLVGVLAATAAPFQARRLRSVWWALAGVTATTALMAIGSEPLWFVVRFTTGAASGFAFVLTSSMVLDRAALEGRRDWAAILYCGVGLGIALTGAAAPPLVMLGGWRAGWIGLAGIAALLCAITLPWLSDRTGARPARAEEVEARLNPRLFLWLVAAYGGFGLGYVIPATFMVAMVAATPELAGYAAASWIVVGFVAVPSTLIWNRIGLSLGRDRALALVLLIMGLGAVAPIAFPSAFGVAVAAATLGGGVMGATALANALGRQLYPSRSQIAIGRLTGSFGLGQIVGPAAAGLLVSGAGTYTPALLLAGAVLCASAAIMFGGSIFAAPVSVEGQA